MSKKYVGVETANKDVLEFEQDAHSVYIRTNIHQVEVKDDMGGTYTKTVYDETQYSLAEYATLMRQQNQALDAQLADCEIALAELYERGVQ